MIFIIYFITLNGAFKTYHLGVVKLQSTNDEDYIIYTRDSTSIILLV